MIRVLALIENGIVANVIVGDPANYLDGVDVTDAAELPGVGFAHDGAVFTAPQQAPEPVAIRIPRDDFIERFGDQWIAAEQAAKTDAKLALAFAILMGKADGMVTLSSPRVGQALAYMVAIGLLTPEHAAAIGAAP